MSPLLAAVLCIVAGILSILSGLWSLGLLASDGAGFEWAPSQLVAIIQIAAGPAFFVMAVGHLRRPRD